MKNIKKLLYFVVVLCMLNSVIAFTTDYISTNKNSINVIGEDSILITNIIDSSLDVSILLQGEIIKYLEINTVGGSLKPNESIEVIIKPKSNIPEGAFTGNLFILSNGASINVPVTFTNKAVEPKPDLVETAPAPDIPIQKNIRITFDPDIIHVNRNYEINIAYPDYKEPEPVRVNLMDEKTGTSVYRLNEIISAHFATIPYTIPKEVGPGSYVLEVTHTPTKIKYQKQIKVVDYFLWITLVATIAVVFLVFVFIKFLKSETLERKIHKAKSPPKFIKKDDEKKIILEDKKVKEKEEELEKKEMKLKILEEKLKAKEDRKQEKLQLKLQKKKEKAEKKQRKLMLKLQKKREKEEIKQKKIDAKLARKEAIRLEKEGRNEEKKNLKLEEERKKKLALEEKEKDKELAIESKKKEEKILVKEKGALDKKEEITKKEMAFSDKEKDISTKIKKSLPTPPLPRLESFKDFVNKKREKNNIQKKELLQKKFEDEEKKNIEKRRVEEEQKEKQLKLEEDKRKKIEQKEFEKHKKIEELKEIKRKKEAEKQEKIRKLEEEKRKKQETKEAEKYILKQVQLKNKQEKYLYKLVLKIQKNIKQIKSLIAKGDLDKASVFLRDVKLLSRDVNLKLSEFNLTESKRLAGLIDETNLIFEESRRPKDFFTDLGLPTLINVKKIRSKKLPSLKKFKDSRQTMKEIGVEDIFDEKHFKKKPGFFNFVNRAKPLLDSIEKELTAEKDVLDKELKYLDEKFISLVQECRILIKKKNIKKIAEKYTLLQSCYKNLKESDLSFEKKIYYFDVINGLYDDIKKIKTKS